MTDPTQLPCWPPWPLGAGPLLMLLWSGTGRSQPIPGAYGGCQLADVGRPGPGLYDGSIVLSITVPSCSNT